MAGGEYDLLTESAAESAKESSRSFAKPCDPVEPNSAMIVSKEDTGLAKLKREFELLSEAHGKGGMTDSSAAEKTALNVMKVQHVDDVDS